jgi:3-dehydro-4-phosphotetronate decarboxylase
VRRGDHIWLTPTGVSLRDLHEEQIAVVDVQGTTLYGPPPTREADMHLGVLRARPDVNAVCHLHGAHIIAASLLLEPGPCTLPALTPGFAYYAFPLPMLPFRVPGNKDLATDVADTLSFRGASAVLLQNHGLVTVGTDLREALDIAEEIDEAAHVYLLAGGKAPSIPERDIRAITSRRKG